MNPHLKAVQDKAWDIKERCDDLAARRLYGPDEAVLQAVMRDLERIEPKLLELLGKYKRKRKPTASTEESQS